MADVSARLQAPPRTDPLSVRVEPEGSPRKTAKREVGAILHEKDDVDGVACDVARRIGAYRCAGSEAGRSGDGEIG